jgi:large subunit ribosomal protein L33
VSDRTNIVLVCTVCQARNYKTTRSGKPGVKALEKKKYCPTCDKHTVHKESK